MPTATVPRIFISATTRDLGSFRTAVRDVLLKKDAHPVIQDDFPPDHRSVVAMIQDKISQCGAVICLVGGSYGYEPIKRDAEEPRRSYTQLEYEIAVELGKPVFVFLATDDCKFDTAADEPDELRELQREHRKRIIASDRIRMTFHSREHLTDMVRIMDLKSLDAGLATKLVVLMFAELIGVDAVQRQRGEEALVRDVVQPFRKLLDLTRARWHGTLRAETSGEYDVNFQTADDAVNAALTLHAALPRHDWPGEAPRLRVGIHVGQIVEFVVDEIRVLQTGHAMDVCRQMTRKAVAGQTLLTRTAYDIASEHIRQAPSPSEDGAAGGEGSGSAAVKLAWQAHGRYLMSDAEEVLDVYEVGVVGVAPFVAPPGSIEQQQKIPPWRPAVGQEVPHRPGYFLERKLGEGGFGEVWVAEDQFTRELRVFKFCFDASRLSSFERELTLVRLLRDELGKRDDIARLINVNLKEGPFFLESEYVDGGNLRAWGEADGRLASLPLKERLRLLAEIAAAVAGAHSVGVIHKDLKPGNIFMRQDSGGHWHPILADFGIGAIDDPARFKGRNLTIAGLTVSLPRSGGQSGTPMYQPPEAGLGRTATIQWDVYALGVLLYQMVIGDFNQPLAHGWERGLEMAQGSDGRRRLPSPPAGEGTPDGRLRKAATAPAPDSSGELVLRLLKDDIGACVEGDPSLRLGSVAQLKERLETLDKRVADAQAGRRAERARVRLRRLGAALAASVAALVVVGGVGSFAVIEWWRAEALQKATDEARKAAVDNEQRAIRGEKQAVENGQQAARNERRAVENEQRAAKNAVTAEANANAARQQSQLALDTLNEVIFDIQGSVENLPGSSLIRRRLLSTALKRLEQLSGEFVQRSTADRHTAAALASMGDLVLKFGETARAGEATGPNGWRPSGPASAVESARGLYARALEIFVLLDRAKPNDAQSKRDLSVTYGRLVDVHLKVGAIEQALEACQKDLELSKALAKTDPDDAQAKRDLSISYNKLGDIHMKLQAADKALESYQNGLELRKALAKADPNDAQAKRDLSISYNKLGDVHLQLGANDKALAAYKTYHELCEALAKTDPDDARAKRDLSISCKNLGDVHLRLGATDKALEAYLKGNELSEALAKTDPNDAQAKRDLSISYKNLGDVHLKLGATDKALEAHQKGLELSGALAKADPNDAQAKRDLSVSYNKLGDVQLKLGATDKALQFYRGAVDLCAALDRAHPDDLQAQRDVSASFYKMAQAYERAGDLVQAREWDEKMLAIDRRLSERMPKDSGAHREVAGDCEVLSRICTDSKDWPAAVTYARQALEHAEVARRLAGGDPNFRWDSSITLRMLGVAQNGAGQFKEARQSLEGAIKANPKYAEAYNTLAWVLAKCQDSAVRDASRAIELATKACELTEWKLPGYVETLVVAHTEAGRLDGAVNSQKKAMELREALAKAAPNDATARRELAISCDKLGDLYLRQGAAGDAQKSYQKGLGLRETLAKAHGEDRQSQRDLSVSFYKMAQAYERAGDLVQAREWDEKMLAIDRQLSEQTPKDASARREVASDCETLRRICAQSADWPAAVSYARQALEHAQAARDIASAGQPFQWDFVITFRQLSAAQIGAGQFKEAKQSIDEALKAGPLSAGSCNGLAWLHATCWEDSIRDGKKAIELATKACELSESKIPTYFDTLAAAHAESGQFDDAIKWQKKAVEHPEAFDTAEFEKVKQRLKLYEARKPYHEPKPEPTKPGLKEKPH
jgi:tetratricopeptide (TPR) repeat protein